MQQLLTENLDPTVVQVEPDPVGERSEILRSRLAYSSAGPVNRPVVATIPRVGPSYG
jgi:hypothetical protein